VCHAVFSNCLSNVGRSKELFLLLNRVTRFFLVKHTKTGEIYQITTKYTQWLWNIPNGHKMDRKFIVDPNIATLLFRPKFTQIGIFGLKIGKASGNLECMRSVRFYYRSGLLDGIFSNPKSQFG
jgi:hypothetical protein